MTPTPTLRVLSLFSGIGGFDLACEWAGMEVVGQVEVDPFCNKVLAKHWPHVFRHDDIKTFSVDTLVNLCCHRLSTSEKEKINMEAKEDKYNLAVELYLKGLSIGDVAKFYGISRQAMWMILKRRGCEFRSQLKYGNDNHFYMNESKAPDRVHNLTELAIEKGLLIRKTHCEKCGDNPVYSNGRTGIEAHHPNYNKPLDVVWLCKKCHFEWHENNKAVELAINFSPMKSSRKEVMPDELIQYIEQATTIDLVCGGFP